MKKNALEKHILTRSYSSEAQILELLASRYSSSGEQRPLLILTPTGQNSAGKEKSTSLLHTPQTKPHLEPQYQQRKRSTRIELKLYIKNTLNNQKKIIKKIQHDSSVNTTKVESLLRQYEIPRFEEFVGLNKLWQSYMKDLLFNGKTDTTPTTTYILPKLSTADYSGCLLTVAQSRNTQLVGIRGIVVWDTQHSFILCVPRNEDSREWTESSTRFSASQMVGGFKVVPKKGTIFSFDVMLDNEECLGFTILGSRFEFRNVERSARKFKNHNVINII